MATPEFDPDRPHVKVRGMGSVHFEQDGAKFNSGMKYIGMLKGQPAKTEPKESKKNVRARAAAKIAKKKGKGDDPLDGFRESETPDAVSSAVKEDTAAKQAEENAA